MLRRLFGLNGEGDLARRFSADLSFLRSGLWWSCFGGVFDLFRSTERFLGDGLLLRLVLLSWRLRDSCESSRFLVRGVIDRRLPGESLTDLFRRGSRFGVGDFRFTIFFGDNERSFCFGLE